MAADNIPGAEPISDYRRQMAEIDRLGDEIAVLSTQIQAATYELLVRLREFDKRGGWGHHGARSCAHWLAWRTSLDMGAAREKVRVARALEQLPVLSEAMRKGEVSYSKVRALTRIATPETEVGLVDLARAGTAAHIETIVRACRRYGPKEELDEVRRQHACRYVQVSRDEDGMFILRARLEPVAGAVVVRALDAAVEAIYQKARAAEEIAPSTRAESPGAPRHSACRDTAADELAPGQRRADALVLLAEAALAGGLDPGTGGDRYQVVVHVDAAVLADPAEQGVSALSDAQHVSAETSRRVACDAATVVMTHGADGSVLDVGRKTRSISPALRRALTRRDGGCRFPGCGLALCDAHHVRHWAEGGETSLDNTLLLCRYHHRLVHEEGFQLKLLAGGEAEFRRPDGRLLPDAPVAPPTADFDLALAVAKQLRDGALVVDPYTSTPTWDGSSVDVSLAVEWFLAKFDHPQRKDEAVAAKDAAGDDETWPGEEVRPAVHAMAPEELDDDDDEADTADGRDCIDGSCACSTTESPRRRIRTTPRYPGETPSAFTYVFTNAAGKQLPITEAIWDPDFHLEWNDDEIDDGPLDWVIPTSDN